MYEEKCQRDVAGAGRRPVERTNDGELMSETIRPMCYIKQALQCGVWKRFRLHLDQFWFFTFGKIFRNFRSKRSWNLLHQYVALDKFHTKEVEKSDFKNLSFPNFSKIRNFRSIGNWNFFHALSCSARFVSRKRSRKFCFRVVWILFTSL